MRAVSAKRRPEPGNPLKPWLFTILRNLWLNQLRHRRGGPRFIRLDSDENVWPCLSDATNDPQVVHLRTSERNAVRTAIEGLPPLHREVVVLRDIEGFSYREIAEIVGCPAGTVMSRLGRARESLKRSLAAWYADADEAALTRPRSLSNP